MAEASRLEKSVLSACVEKNPQSKIKKQQTGSQSSTNYFSECRHLILNDMA